MRLLPRRRPSDADGDSRTVVHALRDLAALAIDTETSTQAGRANMLVIVGSFLLVVLAMSTAQLEAIVRLLRPEAQFGLDLSVFLTIFFIWSGLCVGGLMFLEDGNRRR